MIDQPRSNYWPDRRHAAADLTELEGEPFTARTLKGWVGQPGCPLQAGPGPIEKAPLITWVRNGRRRPGRQRGGNRHPGADGETSAELLKLQRDKLREEIQKLRLFNKRTDRRTVLAEQVTADARAEADSLGKFLCGDLLGRLFDISTTNSRLNAIEQNRAAIIATVNAWSKEPEVRDAG